MNLYPLLFKPIYLQKIWGGNKISGTFNRSLDQDYIGESWELIDNNASQSIVCNGNMAGRKLSDLFCKEIMGSKVVQEFKFFPLIVKYLDASDNLSVQVHPSNKNCETTKNEIWYFLEKPEKEKIILGIDNEYHIDNIEDSLNYLSGNDHDCLYIPSGTVHSLTKGSFVLEIQECCDITYRLFDWNRIESDGTQRELHIDEAKKHINLEFKKNDWYCRPKLIHSSDSAKISVLKQTKSFTLEKWEIVADFKTASLDKSFSIFNILDGTLSISTKNKSYNFKAGDTVLLPAQFGKYNISGPCSIIHTHIE